MNQYAHQSSGTQSESQNIGTVIPFEGINEPGAYIANWNGHLIRVPEDAVTRGRSPLINMVGPEQLTVTRISCNPFVTGTKARLLSSNLDVDVNF